MTTINQPDRFGAYPTVSRDGPATSDGTGSSAQER